MQLYVTTCLVSQVSIIITWREERKRSIFFLSFSFTAFDDSKTSLSPSLLFIFVSSNAFLAIFRLHFGIENVYTVEESI